MKKSSSLFSIIIFKPLYFLYSPTLEVANCFSLLDGTTDQHPSGQGDGENKRFEWIPISQINNYNWAYNMDKTVVYIYNKFLKDISKTKEMFSKL